MSSIVKSFVFVSLVLDSIVNIYVSDIFSFKFNRILNWVNNGILFILLIISLFFQSDNVHSGNEYAKLSQIKSYLNKLMST